MPSDRQAVELTRRYQRQLALLAARSETALTNIWDGLGSWDDTDVDRFAMQATPTVAGTQRASTALTAGYLALLLGAAVAVAKAFELPDLRDPFVGYWAALNRGDPWEQAITTGRTRAGTLGVDSVQEAARGTADEIDRGEDRIVGWERVLSGLSCEWCATVATQRYRTAESASFGHQRCDCTVVPIIGRQAPGRVINRGLLDQLKNLGDDATGYVTNDGTPAPRPTPAPVEVP